MSVVETTVRIRVEIEGMPPGLLFQGKGVMIADEEKGRPSKPRPPEEEARLRAHWGPDKKLAIPWVMLYNSICKAGAAFKSKGRKTFESVLAPTISCETDLITLGTAKFEVFEEWVKIPPRTGAMVRVGRPKLTKWAASFVLLADAEGYDATHLEKIITEAGKNVGIGAWRPQLKGPYGRFRLKQFKIL